MALLHGYEDWYSLTRSLMDLNFKQLGDTPDSYVDKAGLAVKVSADETALVFSDTIIDAPDAYPQYIRHGLAEAASDFLVASGLGVFIKKTLAQVKTILGLDGAPTFSTIYPVGSIYISVISTNPNTLFGMGTWVAFGAGKVPVGFNAAETEFDVSEETGGEKTHVLSVSELATHDHPMNAGGLQRPMGMTGTQGFAGSNTASDWGMVTVSSNGSNTPHNNLQPYIVVYMWKRTA